MAVEQVLTVESPVTPVVGATITSLRVVVQLMASGRHILLAAERRTIASSML